MNHQMNYQALKIACSDYFCEDATPDDKRKAYRVILSHMTCKEVKPTKRIIAASFLNGMVVDPDFLAEQDLNNTHESFLRGAR